MVGERRTNFNWKVKDQQAKNDSSKLLRSSYLDKRAYCSLQNKHKQECPVEHTTVVIKHKTNKILLMNMKL